MTNPESHRTLTPEVLSQLSAGFRPEDIGWLPKPGKRNGTFQARCYPFIDRTAVISRLNRVVGRDRWQFDIEVLPSPGGKVFLRGVMTVLGTCTTDVGEADAEDENALTSAYTQALKRTAQHFGVGLYLGYLPAYFGEYDADKRALTKPPSIKPADLEKALALCGCGTKPVPAPGPASGPKTAEKSSQAGSGPAGPETGATPQDGGNSGGGAVSGGAAPPAGKSEAEATASPEMRDELKEMLRAGRTEGAVEGRSFEAFRKVAVSAASTVGQVRGALDSVGKLRESHAKQKERLAAGQ